MENKKLSITELAEIVNKKLNEENVSAPDGRFTNQVSERRIRDYVSKGLLDKPLGSGPNKWYDESHVQKLFALRQMQTDGLSDQYLKKMLDSDSLEGTQSGLNNLSIYSIGGAMAQSTNNEVLQNNALDFLSGLSGKSDGLVKSSSTAPYVKQRYQNFNEIKNDFKLKQYDEYALTNDEKIIFKVEQGVSEINEDEIINKIKQILKNRNKKS